MSLADSKIHGSIGSGKLGWRSMAHWSALSAQAKEVSLQCRSGMSVCVRRSIGWAQKNLEFDISHESDPVQLLHSNGSVLAIFDESEPFLDLRLSPESSRAVSAVTMVMTGLNPEQRAARRKMETLRADLVILVGVLALFGTLAFALLSPRGSDVLTPSSALPILLGCWFIAAGTLRRRRAQRRSAR